MVRNQRNVPPPRARDQARLHLLRVEEFGVATGGGIWVAAGVDFLFFTDRFWERLTVNAGIVLVFAAFYFRFLKHPRARRWRGVAHPRAVERRHEYPHLADSVNSQLSP